jgi:hypothetical protein
MEPQVSGINAELSYTYDFEIHIGAVWLSYGNELRKEKKTQSYIKTKQCMGRNWYQSR